MTDCPGCGGRVVDAYRLPGGDVVHAADVPFTDGPSGVTAVRACRACGTVVDDSGGGRGA